MQKKLYNPVWYKYQLTVEESALITRFSSFKGLVDLRQKCIRKEQGLLYIFCITTITILAVFAIIFEPDVFTLISMLACIVIASTLYIFHFTSLLQEKLPFFKQNAVEFEKMRQRNPKMVFIGSILNQMKFFNTV